MEQTPEFPYDLTTKLMDIACAPVSPHLATVAYRFFHNHQLTEAEETRS